MKFLYSIACTFIVTCYASAQHLDLAICNDIEKTKERNNCLKNSLENLIFKELRLHKDMLRLQPGDTTSLDLEIAISKVGNFSAETVSTPSFAVARAVNTAISKIKPIAMYKDDEGNFVATDFWIRKRFFMDETEKLYVLDVDNQKREFTNEDNAEEKKQADTTETTTFSIIENVPVFPGCETEKSNQVRKKCMNSAIHNYILKNFDLNMAQNLDLEAGKHRISIQFTINTSGYVSDVIARGPHPRLEAEAIRLVESLPRMKPGLQRGTKVSVLYSLPIVFQVEEDKKKGRKKRKRK